MLKRCKICGEMKERDVWFYQSSQPSKSKSSKRVKVWDSYCKPCRSIFSNERRKNIKTEAVNYLGGKCRDCSLVDDCVDVYDFHHLDPTQKDFQIGKKNWSFEKIKSELDKCVLVCAVCHRKIHAKKSALMSDLIPPTGRV